MFEIGIVAQFEAAHRLVGDFGPATRLHGHSYRMEVIVRGSELHADGTLYDIGRLKPAVEALAAELHYQDLGQVPGLAEVNTTAENVACYCWERLAAELRGRGLAELSVRIWENAGTWAAFTAAL